MLSGRQRETGNILAYLDIQEQGTGKFIGKDISGLVNCGPTRETGLMIRAYPLFTSGVSIVHTRGADSWIIDARADGDLKPIAAGDYTAFVTIVCGERVHKVSRNFKVGSAEHLTIWI